MFKASPCVTSTTVRPLSSSPPVRSFSSVAYASNAWTKRSSASSTVSPQAGSGRPRDASLCAARTAGLAGLIRSGPNTSQMLLSTTTGVAAPTPPAASASAVSTHRANGDETTSADAAARTPSASRRSRVAVVAAAFLPSAVSEGSGCAGASPMQSTRSPWRMTTTRRSGRFGAPQDASEAAWTSASAAAACFAAACCSSSAIRAAAASEASFSFAISAFSRLSLAFRSPVRLSIWRCCVVVFASSCIRRVLSASTSCSAAFSCCVVIVMVSLTLEFDELLVVVVVVVVAVRRVDTENSSSFVTSSSCVSTRTESASFDRYESASARVRSASVRCNRRDSCSATAASREALPPSTARRSATRCGSLSVSVASLSLDAPNAHRMLLRRIV